MFLSWLWVLFWILIYKNENNVQLIGSLTALFGGYGVGVNASAPKAVVRLPFPQSTTWYLTLQLLCNG